MSLTFSRRSVLAGAAALPFLRVPGARAATPGTLTFGLSSYPPSILPWANSGTAAATIKLMIYRGLTGFAADGSLRGELAESWAAGGKHGLGVQAARCGVPERREGHERRREVDDRAGRGREIDRLSARADAEHRQDRDARRQDRALRDEGAGGDACRSSFANFHMPIISRVSDPKTPVGAGPFMIKAQERGVSIDLEAFPKYYKPGLPKLKAVRAIAYADENLRVAALQAGDIDLIEYVPWQSMEAISKDAEARARRGRRARSCISSSMRPSRRSTMRACARRSRMPSSARRSSRRRSSAAARRWRICRSPKASEFFDAELENGWNYDPALAKKLLAEAGHPNGFACSLLSTAQYGMHKDTAEVVQQNLAAIGIKVELNLPDWATRVAVGNKGQYDMADDGRRGRQQRSRWRCARRSTARSRRPIRGSWGMKTEKLTELLQGRPRRVRLRPSARRSTRSWRRSRSRRRRSSASPGAARAMRCRSACSGFKNLPGALTFYSGMTFEDATVG